MRTYGEKSYLKKKVSYDSKENSEKISKLNFTLINQIIDTVNISLMVLIFVLSFLLSCIACLCMARVNVLIRQRYLKCAGTLQFGCHSF